MIFTKIRNHKKQMSQGMIRAGIVISFLIFLTALASIPPLRFGVYLQLEGVISSFWVMGGISAAWVYALIVWKPRLALKICSVPVVWGWVPLILFSILTSLIRPVPLLSWVGSPTMCEGILTFMTLMCMSFIFVTLNRIPVARAWMIAFAIAVGLAMGLLTVLCSAEAPFEKWKFSEWAPIFFSDYIAFFLVSLIVFYAVGLRTYRYKWILHGAVLPLALFIAYYSASKTLMIGFFLACFVVLLLEIKRMQFLSYAVKLYGSFLFLTVGMTIFVAFYDFFLTGLPEGVKKLIPPAIHLTLESRTYLVKVVWVDLFHMPFSLEYLARILLGVGWGQYFDVLLKNVFLLKEIVLFQGSEWSPNWEFFARDMLHSHNEFVDYGLALGVFGFIYYGAIKWPLSKALAPQYRRVGALFLLFMAIINVFWFQIPLTFTFGALASALIFTGRTKLPLSIKPIRYASMVMMPLLVLWGGIHGVMTYGLGSLLYIGEKRSFDQTLAAYYASDAVQYDNFLGGKRTTVLARSYMNDISIYLKKDKRADPMSTMNLLLKLAQQVYFEVNVESNVHALILPLNVMGALSVEERTKTAFEKEEKLRILWSEMAGKLTHVMPYRSDLLIPYFSFMAIHEWDEDALPVLEKLLGRRPHDPIALWYKGLSLLKKHESFQTGICMMKKAVRFRVSSFMPVTPEELEKIQKAQAICPAEE